MPPSSLSPPAACRPPSPRIEAPTKFARCLPHPQTCQRPLPADDGILPTKLFTHREDVDAINGQQLRALPGEPRRFASQDVGSAEVLAAACPARRTLDLKVREQGQQRHLRGAQPGWYMSQRKLAGLAPAHDVYKMTPPTTITHTRTHALFIALTPSPWPRRRWAPR
jgi:hypothetical protein